MNADFAQYVDPIFMRVLDLLLFIEEGGRPSASEQKQVIGDEIHRAAKELKKRYGNSEDRDGDSTWDLAKYAIVSWVDEELSRALDEDERKKLMGAGSLEWEHFGSNERYQKFYVKAKKAAEKPEHNDALETYYLCVMLGFRGLYGEEDPEQLKAEVTQYRLPDDLAEWASEVGSIIQERNQRKLAERDATPFERIVATARPLWERHLAWWPWLFALLLLMGFLVWRQMIDPHFS